MTVETNLLVLSHFRVPTRHMIDERNFVFVTTAVARSERKVSINFGEESCIVGNTLDHGVFACPNPRRDLGRLNKRSGSLHNICFSEPA